MSYYFISIGGSGAKVLESFTHLCAAGLMPSNEPLYVMDIDPDNGNGNLSRSKATFEAYSDASKMKFGTDTFLCKTKIHEQHPIGNYVWSPIVDANKDLQTIMGHALHKNTPLGDLFEILYTQDERKTQLDVGFRGHPAIGAAVLAKNVNSAVEQQEPWSSFKKCVEADATRGDVKIFITGSIFGGTGAAGIPNIAKLIKVMFSSKNGKNNTGLAEKIQIGGGLILPYFKCMPNATEKQQAGMCVTSNDFLPNTQAALKYYYVQHQTDSLYNAMYFIGAEEEQEGLEFSTGSVTQKNDAHIVDFYAGLAAIDFFGRDLNRQTTCYYIGHGKENIEWNDMPEVRQLDTGSSVKVRDKFDQFARFVYTYDYLIRPILDKVQSGKKIKNYQYPWYKDYFYEKNIDLTSSMIKGFNNYVDRFLEWSYQISQQNTSLINPNTVLKEENKYTVSQDRVSSAIGEVESNANMDEVWYRLCEHKCDDTAAVGMGRFLRVLYDCCEKR